MIISDATAVITLININEFELLKVFTQKIFLPQEVYDEIANNIQDKIFIDQQREQKFIEVIMVKNLTMFNELNIILDNGESAAIALALETNMPLIIDEKKGRSQAKQMGVNIIGLIGILRFLFIEKKITFAETQKIIYKLNGSNFRISNNLIKLILKPL